MTHTIMKWLRFSELVQSTLTLPEDGAFELRGGSRLELEFARNTLTI